jgi:DNA/RNA-binding domain of Phe-tRNA-synthetase-like protein
MFFKIFEEVFRNYPKLKVAAIVAKDIDNSKKTSKVKSLLKEAVDYVKLTFTPEKDTDPKLIPKKLAKSPLISAWRSEYEEYGTKEHYNTNVETLMTDILSGNVPKSRNNLLDMCTYLSLKQMVPMGVYDLDKIEGDIFLGLANGGETFVAADSKAELIDKNEVIYYDGSDVLCRKWNWKTSSKAEVDEETTNAIVLLDILPPLGDAELKVIVNEAKELIEMGCGGKLTSKILDKKERTIEIK